MSRKSAELIRNGDSVVVRNLSDKNPLQVNAEWVAPGATHPLRADDMLTVGSSKFQVIFE